MKKNKNKNKKQKYKFVELIIPTLNKSLSINSYLFNWKGQIIRIISNHHKIISLPLVLFPEGNMVGFIWKNTFHSNLKED